jgi:hypothetical protein
MFGAQASLQQGSNCIRGSGPVREDYFSGGKYLLNVPTSSRTGPLPRIDICRESGLVHQTLQERYQPTFRCGAPWTMV